MTILNYITYYRPISLLSQFSKILQKIFHNRVMSFVEEKNILYESQYRFRKHMSTLLAILELVENITCSIHEFQRDGITVCTTFPHFKPANTRLHAKKIDIL